MAYNKSKQIFESLSNISVFAGGGYWQSLGETSEFEDIDINLLDSDKDKFLEDVDDAWSSVESYLDGGYSDDDYQPGTSEENKIEKSIEKINKKIELLKKIIKKESKLKK